MPIDVKLDKAQVSNTIQSGRYLRYILGNLGKKSNDIPCYCFS